MNRLECGVAVPIAAGLIASAVHGGTVLRVDDDAAPGGDGLSWDTAYRFLREALADVSGPTEIRVAQGTYTPDRSEANPGGTGDRQATFQLIDGAALRGGYAGAGWPDPDQRDLVLYETVLSGDLLANDLLDFINNDENSYHVVTCSGADAGAALDGFTITGGNANGLYGEPTGSGGGIFNSAGSPVVSGCTFRHNAAAFSGGGMHNHNSSPSVVNCVFSDNRVIVSGGAMGNFASSPEVTNCLFLRNETVVDDPDPIGLPAGARGGGGGAMFNDYVSSPTLANCTFSGNRADFGAGIYNGGSVTVDNCIFWGNLPDQIWGEPDADAVIVRYSDVQNGFPGPANIDADPLFADPDQGDHSLSPGSPCIDAGHNWAIAGLADTDLDGDPRFAADELGLDLGCGVPVVVDMGAFEYEGDAFPVKLGDIDGNGVVAVNDFLLLLAGWGACTQDCCLSDLDLSGDTGVTDVVILLANWG
ncbi:MAG: right-handed parallel beta-helix repeat-containing protein [Planctomycetota bacterium]|jgi:hypothetical protein